MKHFLNFINISFLWQKVILLVVPVTINLFATRSDTQYQHLYYLLFIVPALLKLYQLAKIASIIKLKVEVDHYQIDISFSWLLPLLVFVVSVCISQLIQWEDLCWSGWIGLDEMAAAYTQYSQGFNLPLSQPSLSPLIHWIESDITRETWSTLRLHFALKDPMPGQVPWSVSVLLADDLFRLVYC